MQVNHRPSRRSESTRPRRPSSLCLTFGKHSGEPIGSLPLHYLRWLQGINLDAQLADAIDHEVAYRERRGAR